MPDGVANPQGVREDGQEHRSPVIGQTRCEWCGDVVDQRSEGRTRRFCGPAHRMAAYRAARRRRAPEDAVLPGQTDLVDEVEAAGHGDPATRALAEGIEAAFGRRH